MGSALARIRAILTATPLRWSQLAGTIDDGLMRERPAAAEWSALECLQHLVDTERHVFPPRLEALRHKRDIPAFDPATQGSQGAGEQSPAALATVRAEILANQATHSELGVVTLDQLLHEWAAHDLDHTIQAERALMQPFIRGCGPWQPYFAANRIEP